MILDISGSITYSSRIDIPRSGLPSVDEVKNQTSPSMEQSSPNNYSDRVTLSKDQPPTENNQNELTEDEKKEVQQLKDRDREVRIHEQAHAAVGGQYAGSPTYEYKTGPDGKKYAVGGEVSIDVSEEEKPEDTIQKMQVVRAAALAPAEPSTQDLKVAAEASQKESSARAELSKTRILGDGEKQDESSQPEAVSTIVANQVLQYEKSTSPVSNTLSITA